MFLCNAKDRVSTESLPKTVHEFMGIRSVLALEPDISVQIHSSQ